MCRMLFALGDFDVNALIDDAITMALDKNEKHENNADSEYRHPDGWGVCYLQGERLVVKKSATAIFDDAQVDELRNIRTNLLVIHARLASKGGVNLQNVHPFSTELNGQQFLFFHNGTVYDDLAFSPRFQTKGSTDSEKLFYYLLSQNGQSVSKEYLRAKLEKLHNFTAANFILVSPKKVYVANWYSATPRYYTMKMLQDHRTTIISSEILPHYRGKNWHPLRNREILAFPV